MRQVSCYATANNILEKSADELAELRALGLSLLYIGPESGDALTLKRIVKGASFGDHVQAARKAHAAGMQLSAIALLGAGGVAALAGARRGHRRARDRDGSGVLRRAHHLDRPGDAARAHARQRACSSCPTSTRMLQELRIIVAEARPTNALFRTNHASNHLPLGGRLPRDRELICAAIDAALAGEIPLRPDSLRGLVIGDGALRKRSSATPSTTPVAIATSTSTAVTAAPIARARGSA